MQKGFTLIETLIGSTLFIMITSVIYFSYSNIVDISISAQLNQTALSALENELEIIRSMPYEDIGIQGGSPSGVLLAEKNLTFSGVPFVINTTVRNIDDLFDGTIGGLPNDTSPADYKLVELEILCPTCTIFLSSRISTTVAPVNLETTTGNGALFINVFDAYGQPVQGVSVNVVNTQVNPNIIINDVTNNVGQLKLVDAPPSTIGYQIIISKSDYSNDKTYTPGEPSNPNPIKPHATVVQGQATEISFSSDRVSSLNIKTQDKFCAGVPSIDFSMNGGKLIGTDPDVLKYSQNYTSDSTGNKIINDLEWDNYNIQNIDSGYDIKGTSILGDLTVDPNTAYTIRWLMAQKNPSSLLISVMDSLGQSINDAEIILSKSGFNETKRSGLDLFDQSDWSSGNYSSKSPNADPNSFIGELRLANIGGKFASMSEEWLISETYDLGNSETTFYDINWDPISQLPQTGINSLKFQVATNNDNLTWNFIGPDGTANTFYSTSGDQLHASHNDNRYFRYKAYLRTDDDNFTPSLDYVSFGFSSSCLIIGQAFFNELNTGTYNIIVNKQGFQQYINTILIDSSWKSFEAILSP